MGEGGKQASSEVRGKAKVLPTFAICFSKIRWNKGHTISTIKELTYLLIQVILLKKIMTFYIWESHRRMPSSVIGANGSVREAARQRCLPSCLQSLICFLHLFIATKFLKAVYYIQKLLIISVSWKVGHMWKSIHDHRQNQIKLTKQVFLYYLNLVPKKMYLNRFYGNLRK